MNLEPVGVITLMLTCEHEAIAVEMLRAADRASAVGIRSTSGPPRPSASRRVWRPPDPGQLQQVVGEADEESLSPDLDQAAEREATEVARVLYGRWADSFSDRLLD